MLYCCTVRELCAVDLNPSAIPRTAMDKKAKRARVEELASQGCNAAQVHRVLTVLKKHPELLEDNLSERQLQRAAPKAFDRVRDTLKLARLNGGDDFEWGTCSLPAALQDMARNSSEYFHLLADTHAKHPTTPATPWKAVVYFDEATPGAVLHLDNHEKTWCVYVTFLNFGPTVLQHGQAWFP